MLDAAPDALIDPDELVHAAMRWHFSPETGSPFWIERAKTLGFDPVADVTSWEQLRRFPNVTDELRGVAVADLIPRGFGSRPDVVSVIESGGTTGDPKRIPLLRQFAEFFSHREAAVLDRAGVPLGANWLAMLPAGPHGAFEQIKRAASVYSPGSLVFGIDLDPRWVKKQASAGHADVVNDYIEHIIDQAAFVLRGQPVAAMRVTPPVLARMLERDDLLDIIRQDVRYLVWGGASMDAEARHYYRTELVPDTVLSTRYGTTMALGAGGAERPGLGDDDPCIIDPSVAPYVTLSVVDPVTQEPVAYGERGQVIVNHVSKSFLLPNNAERDTALRIEPLTGQVGDSIADIEPLSEFGGVSVVEGVY
ncbi:hypothetical protein [Compostimonas suwonensis]|uniref:hypothetical protein n=1 Tax=Compostimonas suwonensis TaxID=1048394 RepID=UPI001B80723C|nr:hypothetical protein [Compostimonas suwonensis]